MKKFLCLLIMLCMLPVSAIFLTSCKKDSDITEFYTSYINIAEKNEFLTLVPVNYDYGLNIQADKIDLDYSKSAELSALVENSSTNYYQLKYFYQAELDNSLAPLYFFGKSLSQSKEISQKQCNALFEKLKSLEEEYVSIDYYFNILASSLKSTTSDSINQTYLKKLFAQYERTIEKASSLSALVNNLYFNKVLTNANPNYTKNSYEELSDADLVAIANSVKFRVYYYKSMYANIYNELYINGNGLDDKIINGFNVETLTYKPYDYISSINSLTTKEIQQLRNNKQTIYENIVSLHNIQNQIDDDYDYFSQVKDEVIYAKINSSSSVYEKNCGTMIEQFAYGIALDSYQVLSNLITAIFD